MGFGKFLLGGICAVGAVVAAPVVLPAAAAVGTMAAGAGTAVAGAAAAAGTAAAGTAVGAAAVEAMAVVGGAVGTVAGAAGISSVATVAGTTAGSAAVGAITASTAAGVIGAASGIEKMKEASETKEIAECKYKKEREVFDKAEAEANMELESLGKLKVNIWNGFNRFVTALKKIGNPEELKELGLDEDLEFDQDELESIKEFGIQAKDILQGGVTSIAGGKLIGLATSAGFSSLSTASTIAGLHGAAAANASLAALGGGSLASGGLGMAGGAMVTQGLAFAPALAIGGMFLNGKGKKNLELANKTKEEVDKFTIQVSEAKIELKKLQDLSIKMRKELCKYKELYDQRIDWFEEFIENNKDMINDKKRFKESAEGKKFWAIAQLTSILKDLTSTKLLSEVSENEDAKVEEEAVNKKISDCSDRWNCAEA